jgi:type IV pilus assembly protein PilW
MKNLNSQAGMSLVELMIAVALSMLLVAGVIQVYVSSKASYEVQHHLSTLQQNERIAVEMLGNQIRKAGLSITKAPQAIDSTAVKDGAGNASDEITIAYESAKNCLGFDTPTEGTDAGIAVDRYFISNGQLYCQGNGSDPQALVPGVVNMQILYGEDTDPILPGQRRSANRYVKPADADMLNVVSVRISLLVESDNVVRGVDEAQKYTRKYFLLDAPELSFSDQKRRHIVTTTIALRNAL